MPDFPYHHHGIILFDGVCVYCSRCIDFIIRHDKDEYFRFASLQSTVAQQLLEQNNFSQKDFSDSVLLIENRKVFSKSTAALRILRKLKFPFSIFFVCIIIPEFIRNFFYDFIASNRYKWFGKNEICRIPITEKEKRIFLV